MSELFFDMYPQFVYNDNRSHRNVAKITSESLSKRAEVLLPKWLVEGKTVLDLGHCVGAFGQWVLCNGAKHYTGVDINKDFCDISNKLLSANWSTNQYEIVNSEINDFLSDKQYDIVIAAGLIHGYFDVVGLLKNISNASTQFIIIETLDVENTYPAIYFKQRNMASSDINTPYNGWSCDIGIGTLKIIMNEFGFTPYGDRIYPEKIINSHDPYNSPHNGTNRYMIMFQKNVHCVKSSLQYHIKNQIPNGVLTEPQIHLSSDKWQFDSDVAKRFQQEALTNIPDYERVIDMCVNIAKVNNAKTIVDIGSALGYTIKKFNDAGFSNTIGIESSQAMIEQSLFKEHIILSDTWPTNIQADMVLANWTLHFIVERKNYIQDVYNSLSIGGAFIISDKTSQSETIKKMYYDFKRNNGVADEYIYEKEHKLKGYMHVYPIEWYLNTLKEVGFKNIQVINSNLGFVTFYTEK